MKLTFWGTRGSQASPGPDTVRYGGNTSCVEVRAGDGALVVLDAGTGIRRLGQVVGPETTRVDILLTHLHMDHIQGLGFFGPLHRPGLEVHVWGPPSATMSLYTRLTRYLSPPLFPVRLRDLPCSLTVHDVPLGDLPLPGVSARAWLVCHPGPTVGYRLSTAGGCVVYLPDHEPALGASPFPRDPDWTSGFGLTEGADVLIHDAQYTEAEYRERAGWGHSTLGQALELAAMAGVPRLVPFHHDPAHDDDMLDAMFEPPAGHGAIEIVPAREGMTINLAA
jgi:phosphoribosyl 1,2-cyclic phosphodiesterase